MYIIIISDEVESYDILGVINDKSEFNLSLIEEFCDLHNFLAPEIIELCDPIQMEKFKRSQAENLMDLIELHKIPGKIDIPYIDKETLKYWCAIGDSACLEEFDHCRGIFKDPVFDHRDNMETEKLYNSWQKKAGLEPIFYYG